MVEAMSHRNSVIELYHKAATGNKTVRMLLTPVGGLFFTSFVVGIIALSFHIDRVLNLPKILFAPWNVLLSVPLLCGGLFLLLWSLLHFVKARGTPVPFNPPPRLVASGPYAYTRNPMLTGVFALMFGIGTLLGSVTLVFIFTPLFVGLNVLHLRAIEEPELERRLGERYVQYKRETPMFIPRLEAGTKKRPSGRDRACF